MTNPAPIKRTYELWKCGKCGAEYNTAAIALQCCAPCSKCGKDFRIKGTIGGWTICDDCRAEKMAEEEKERFEKATKYKISEWTLPVWDSRTMTYYPDVDSWWDAVEDEYEDEDDAWAWGCVPYNIKFSAEDLIVHEAESYGPVDDLGGSIDGWVESLQEVLDQWCEANGKNAWYELAYWIVIVPDSKQECAYE